MTLALGGVLGAPSSARAAQSFDPSLTTSKLPTMRPGATAWVSTLWTADNRSVANFRMTATSAGATVSYPANTATYSSFYGSSSLARNATDFAALKIKINPSVTSTVTVNLTATYDLRTDNGNDRDRDRDNDRVAAQAHWDDDDDRDRDDRDDDDWVRRTQTRQVTIPIQVVTGASITPLTTSLQPVTRGTERWQQFSVRGEKPGITSLTLRVTAPTGITILYPADGTVARPNESSTLDVGETDYFAFKTVVGSGVAKGSYNLKMSMSFGRGRQQTATIPMTVT